MSQDQLIKLKHRQLQLIKDRMYNTFQAVDVDIYKPIIGATGGYELVSEDDIGEVDPLASASNSGDVEADIKYNETPVQTKAIRVKADEFGTVKFLSSGLQNEYDQDSSFNYMIKAQDIPVNSVMQYEVSKDTISNDKVTVNMIKVDEAVKGAAPAVEVIHIFVPMVGDVD